MRLSYLQKYILRKCYTGTNFKISKKVIELYYAKKKIKPRSIANDITKSVERLIKRELAVGFGRKTSKKWYFTSIFLTPKGRKIAKDLLGKQQKLPLKRAR